TGPVPAGAPDRLCRPGRGHRLCPPRHRLLLAPPAPPGPAAGPRLDHPAPPGPAAVTAVAPAAMVWAVMAAWAATALVMPSLWRSQRLYGPSARNYAGRPVAASGGVMLPLAYGAGCIAAHLAATVEGPGPPAGTGPCLLPAMQAVL